VSEELATLQEDTGIEVLTIPGLDLHDDLDDLAALISCCDLVISVSNATAHLSGALGKPTWLALHQVPYWPWGLEGERSPWYPTLRLFRQGSAGCWREPLEQLRGALEALLGSGARDAEQADANASKPADRRSTD
jgi:hypothetical protein